MMGGIPRVAGFTTEFLAGGLATAEMALGFVELEDLLNLVGQFRVDLGQAFGDILVHGALGDSEDLSRVADGGPAPEDVVADIDNPLPDVISHPSGPFLPPRFA